MQSDKHTASIALLSLLLVASVGATASPPVGELERYVGTWDTSYAWKQIAEGSIGAVDYTELILTSQTWRGIPWKHQLFVLRPAKMHAPTKQAFLFIHGGRWDPAVESSQRTGALPREAQIFARLATSIGAPVAVLRQVPFQPLFERTEDTLIAHTFDQFLKTGEADWPLLLPMVKSAARAMDAVQEHLRARWQIPIESFTVAGASKRGWTSWLIAAVDPRVAAAAPMVIDMLNLPAQIELQRSTFGALSEQVKPYSDMDLPAHVDTEPGRRLLNMVDPYSYRERLTRPKLIFLGSNDRYWPLDALKLYWNELPEPKRVLYVPNQGHGLNDVNRLIGGLSALHRHSAAGIPLPKISWTFTPGTEHLALEIHSSQKPSRITAWTANAATRDFRESPWTSHRCDATRGGYICRQRLSRDEYTAMYAEAQFKERGAPEFSLSTAPCIVAGTHSQSVSDAERQCVIQNE